VIDSVDPAHTNTVEGFFAIIKRGIYGVYHHVSQEHLKRYLCEFDFRYNYRTALGFDDSTRATLAVKGIAGSGLCTDSLVAKPKRAEPPEPRWPDGSPYREPVQLTFSFLTGPDTVGSG